MNRSEQIRPDTMDGQPYIFVSYSREDSEDVQKILRVLRENQFRFWYDQGLKSGDVWMEELGEKIDRCEQFLLILSPNAVKSKYVRKELHLAVERKNMEGQILVVYLRDTELTKGMALSLSDIHAIWKTDYPDETEFARALCMSLSSETQKTTEDRRDAASEREDSTAREQLLKEYDLTETCLGRGGEGTVYLARHRQTGLLAAVKYVQTDQTSIGQSRRSSVVRQRIILAEALNNQCGFVPVVLDCFEDPESVYLAENYLEGSTLDRLDRTYSEENTVEILRKLLVLLSQIHCCGVIHRDIKPANILVDRFDEYHILDFGCAWSPSLSAEPDVPVGTHGYAPPEQFRPGTFGQVTFSTDLYALGRTILYLLCPSMIRNNSSAPLRFLRRDVSCELEAFLDKMTEADRYARFQTAEEALNALEHYRSVGFLRKLRLRHSSAKRIRHFRKENNQKGVRYVRADSRMGMTMALKQTVFKVTTVISKQPTTSGITRNALEMFQGSDWLTPELSGEMPVKKQDTEEA